MNINETKTTNGAALLEAVKETQSVIEKCMDILNKIPDGCAYDGLVEDVADELCALREEHIKPALAATEQEVGYDGTNNNIKAREVLTRVHGFLSNLCKDARCDDHCSECLDASDIADDVYDLLHATATEK